MKRNRNVFFYCLTLVFLFGCKKYEDNPLINLSSKLTRLQGTYYLAAYKIDGVDLTHSIKLDSAVTLSEFNFLIGRQTDPTFPPAIGGSYLNGKCVWQDHKKYLYIFLTKTCFREGPLSEYAGKKYRIKKLTEHQLVLKITYQDKEHEIYFFKES